MAKIFISYKYGDQNVFPLPPRDPSYLIEEVTTARDYVDVLKSKLTDYDHIYKGEHDNEDLSMFKDETIRSALRDKIYDSSITLILISKSMKEIGQNEEDQWIPWEVSYSLKEITRDGRISHVNACLAIGIPDENGSYGHFVNEYTCGCNTWYTDSLFKILGKNMFNRRNPTKATCTYHGDIHIGNDHSYIHPIKLSNFLANMDYYIDMVSNKNINDYDILKEI